MDKVAVTVSLVCALGIFWSCVCRLQMTHRKVIARVRYRYAIMGTGSLFAAFGPFLPGENGGLYGVSIFIACVAVGFWLDRADWKHGVPPSATMPGDLDDGK